MKICRTTEDILQFKERFPIVLKPLKDYGGNGLVKIDGERAWIGNEQISFKTFLQHLPKGDLEYLAVQFLTGVTQGDKRIVVVNGQILGASLRMAPSGSWICNGAMGGTSHFTEVTNEEKEMAEQLHGALAKEGILIFGMDTLVGNDGRRVLSEINTTSIGGFPQIVALSGKPVVREAVYLIWRYVQNNHFQNLNISSK